MSEFEFDKVHRIGIKHQAPYVVSKLQTLGTNMTKMDDEVPVLEITTKTVSSDETKRVQEGSESYEELTEQ